MSDYHISNKLFKHLKIKCNRCNSEKDLRLHHIDRNPSHNFEKNIEVLCRRCHQLEHGKKYVCKYCGIKFNREGHGGTKFCSYKCYWKSMEGAKQKHIKKKCAYCRKTFFGYVQKKDCSYSCKNKRVKANKKL